MWQISEFALVFWTALACVTALEHTYFFHLPNIFKSQGTEYKFDARTQASYKEHKEKVRWSEALARCQAEGAQLAVPHTRREAQVLLELFSGDTEEVWLALHDQFVEGQFVAYDGKKAYEIYTNWGPNEPNNAGKLHNEDCVTMNRHGKYVDIGCDEWQHRFICKKVDACQSPSPSTRGYNFERKTNTYYKENKDYVTWSQALASCQAQGAQLAVPHTREEAAALLELFSSDTVEVWLALHDQFKEGDFITYDEGKHDSDIYTNWNTGEPNNAGVLHNEDCVTMNSRGLYFDIGCDEWKKRYICKIVKHHECPDTQGIHAPFDDDDYDDDEADDGRNENPTIVPSYYPVFFDDGYKYDQNAYALYKEHKYYVSWSEALFNCKAKNAQLAVPHTLKEAQALRKLFSYDTVEVWIGLHDQFSEGHFVTIDASPSTRGYNFERKTNTYYKENKDYVTWSQALASCQAQGAQLAVPHTREEAAALLELFSSDTVEVWLALHDQFKEGDFITYDEGKHDSDIYTNWNTGEPNNAGVLHNEDCVTMNSRGLYFDIGCDEWKHRYICKIVKHPECPDTQGIHAPFDDDDYDDDEADDGRNENPTIVPSNDPVFSDDGYKYDQNAYALYKEHKDYVSWSEALFNCKAENAQLAVPHTLKEAQALRKLFSHDTVEVWIGLHDQFSEGHFVTIDGTPESQIYTNWSAGEPNNAGRNHNEDCVTINRKGLYVDIGCDEWKHRYICEKRTMKGLADSFLG